MVVALLGPQSGRFGQYLSHLVHNHGLEIKWKSLSWKIESLHFKVDLFKIIQFLCSFPQNICRARPSPATTPAALELG